MKANGSPLWLHDPLVKQSALQAHHGVAARPVGGVQRGLQGRGGLGGQQRVGRRQRVRQDQRGLVAHRVACAQQRSE